MRTIVLLVLSNIFMTIAWYGHLKHHRDTALWVAILVSWGIAFLTTAPPAWSPCGPSLRAGGPPLLLRA
jgi:uncharacterized protein (DUF486 family)